MNKTGKILCLTAQCSVRDLVIHNGPKGSQKVTIITKIAEDSHKQYSIKNFL